jgi:sec-independent protein translocase protein TatA
VPFNIGPFELLLVLLLVLLVLGPGKLPEVGSALGRTIREFRKASTDVENSLNVNPSKAAAASAPVTSAADNAAAAAEDKPAS